MRKTIEKPEWLRVAEEFEASMRTLNTWKREQCGVLAHGFTQVRCESCKDEMLIAFPCKGRGVCPSCNAAKRAQMTAAHLGNSSSGSLTSPRVSSSKNLMALPG